MCSFSNFPPCLFHETGNKSEKMRKFQKAVMTPDMKVELKSGQKPWQTEKIRLKEGGNACKCTTRPNVPISSSVVMNYDLIINVSRRINLTRLW